jgi:hypothetical protein
MNRSRDGVRLSRRAALQTAGAGGMAFAAAGLSRSGLAAQTPAGSPAATPVGTPAAAASSGPELVSVPQVFNYGDFGFEFLIALGGTYERAADIGECYAVASQIKDHDYESWVAAWRGMADRVHGIAEASDAKGHRASARDAYLRAATYYGQAASFVEGTNDPGQLLPTWEAHRASADAFFARLDAPARQVTIPYEDTTLPGYALTVDDSGTPRPWLIMNNGSDGTVTDMWVQGAAAVLRQGSSSPLLCAPVACAALFRQRLYFRPDWEKVITPVVDWLLQRSDVDPKRIAILGISQGGYWVPRALAFEHRIAAGIFDPGVFDVSTSFTSFLPPDLLRARRTLKGPALDKVKEELDQGVKEAAAQSPDLRYTLASRLRPYGTTSFADVLIKLQAYNLNGVVDKIQCPVLIADPEGEQFWPGQSEQVYEALRSPKTLVRFTAAEGADLHCEPKANGLREQVYFDWLDETLGITGAAAPVATPAT